MSEAILLLRLEHRHADELLQLIEQQVQARDLPLDLDLLRDICDYFHDYPDKCHHPVEDIVFRKLNARDPEAGAQVQSLLEEHERVAAITAEYQTALRKAEQGGKKDESALRDTLSGFVKHYRSHMYSEERTFFPLAMQTLTRDDWTDIEYDLFDRKDPLFDRDEEGRFRRLRETIENRARQSWERAAFLRRSRRLHHLTGLMSFNRLMSESGLDYELIEHPGGGYGLQRNGEVIVDIPECSPARAAWCAYYYLESTLGRAISV